MPSSAHLTHLPAVLLFACLLCATVDAAQADDTSTAMQLRFFEARIRPLLHARCVKCHGENVQKGGLRLDSREAVLTGGDSGEAAVARDPDQSLIIEAVRYESFEMPPDRQLAAREIADLESWIADGMAWPTHGGASVRLTGHVFTEEEKNFWSLQPVSHSQPPAVEAGWIRNPIDQFVAAQLQEAGLQPAPRASTGVLLRRLYFGLIGMPPSPSELADLDRVSGHEQAADLVAITDQLLSDTRYGEHWSRHWLDIVRYAESDGFRADGYRPEAWRYRDYIVDAFNNDKPYDLFVSEQLAGDEIAPDRAEAVVATGYLRTYLYEYNQRDARTQWQDILDQVTDVTGDAFLGMSVGCARCHDHKFDPILQEDYYRLRASFGTMIPRDDVPAADLVDVEDHRRRMDSWAEKKDLLQKKLDAIRLPYLKQAERAAVTKFPEDIQAIMAMPQDRRNALQHQLADLVNRQVLFEQRQLKYSADDRKEVERLELEIKSVAGIPPASLPGAMTVSDVGPQPFPLHIGQDGERKAVNAGGFSIMDSTPFPLNPHPNTSGQRSALAKWITDPSHPLTARVIVNRIWQQHFGRGLVETASDFGSLGARPSHPKLLDWLASEFVAHGWSIKWLHRIILSSGTWQMSAFHPQPEFCESRNPGNELRWRFDIRRLTAEQIRDAMLAASGELLSETGGPSVDHGSLRRSLYLKVLRNKPEPLLSSLDGVDGLNSVPLRSTTTTPTQALNLMNGDWVRKRSAATARRVIDTVGTEDLESIVDVAFLLMLGRSPLSVERESAVQLVRDSMAAFSTEHQSHMFTAVTAESGRAIRIGVNGFDPVSVGSLSLKPPFTFAAIVKLSSLYKTANVRTIVSKWDNNKSTRGWSIGITSEKSAFKPRNFILQPVGQEGYEVAASNLRPELDRPYMIALSVEQSKAGRGLARFYLQEAGKQKSALRQQTVEFKTAAGLHNNLPVILGGRTESRAHDWDGQLDQVAIFDRSLKPSVIAGLFSQQLNSAHVLENQPTAFWTFDSAEHPERDAANRHDLQIEGTSRLSPFEYGVAELCHVLLNTNEFVYID